MEIDYAFTVGKDAGLSLHFFSYSLSLHWLFQQHLACGQLKPPDLFHWDDGQATSCAFDLWLGFAEAQACSQEAARRRVTVSVPPKRERELQAPNPGCGQAPTPCCVKCWHLMSGTFINIQATGLNKITFGVHGEKQ